MPNFCGPACLSSLLAHLGTRADQKIIASAVYQGEVSGTNGGDLLLYTREKGLPAVSFNGSASTVKNLVASGDPVVVLQDVSQEDRLGHFRIVVGYDEARRVFQLRDNTMPQLLELPYAEFDLLWRPHGNWAMTVASDTHGLVQVDNPVIHMDLAGAYLRKGNLAQAESECRKALAAEPENPYALELLGRITTEKSTSVGQASDRSGCPTETATNSTLRCFLKAVEAPRNPERLPQE